MKILAIRGKNLTALENNFEIDFTTEPLKSSGIFVITGKTGSGKSTILDTLCLALYDKIPRIGKYVEDIKISDVNDKMINQKDSRTILRKGTKEGFAEVDFISLSEEKYRATWKVRRAHSRIDSSLQSSEIKLINLDTSIELQGKKTEILDKIRELVGLNFDQFTRAVLLAQGDFTNFLRAKQNEKAEILEKLTGTEIYSKISIHIFEKTKILEKELQIIEEKIEEISLLSKEEEKSLLDNKKELKEKGEFFKKELLKLNRNLGFINKKKSLEIDINQIKNEIVNYQEELRNSESREYYLQKVEKVQEIKEIYQTLQTLEKQLKDKDNYIHTQKERLKEINNQLNREEVNYEISEKKLRLCREEFIQIEPEIEKAKILILALNSLEKEKLQYEEEINIYQKEKEDLDDVINTDQKNFLNLREELSILEKWLNENKIYEPLALKKDLIINLFEDYNIISESLEMSDKNLKIEKDILETYQKKEKELLEEAINLSAKYPKEVIQLRKQLKDGEPCPVCGSIHHSVEEIASNEELKEEELNKLKEELERKIEITNQKIGIHKQQIIKLNSLIENYKQHKEVTYQKLIQYMIDIPDWTKEVNKDYIEKFKKKLESWLEKQRNYQNFCDQLFQWESKLEYHKRSYDNNNKILREKEGKYIQIISNLNEMTIERESILKGRKLQEILNIFQEEEEKYKSFKEFHKTKIDQLSGEKIALNDLLKQQEKELIMLKDKKEKSEALFIQWRDKQEFFNAEEFGELIQEDYFLIQGEKEKIQELRGKKSLIEATLNEKMKLLKEFFDTENNNYQEEELNHLMGNCQKDNELNDQRLFKIELRLLEQDENIKKYKKIQTIFDENRNIVENWKKLNELLGSATGNKFKTIAQAYTLDTLLEYANIHLRELIRRYELRRVPDSLALEVIDHDMIEEKRSIYSLSGGETFLISLSLALGLSSLSSDRIKIESLFIDEGFGSLDAETFDIVINALENLQIKGRKIGIISHVQEMTERINTQIQVFQENGKSIVKIVG